MLCCYLSEAFYFLVRDRRGSGFGGIGGGQKVGGVEGGETLIWIYCVRKEPVCCKRKTNITH